VDLPTAQIVVCDVALGEEMACDRSFNHMSPEKMADQGKHSITTKDEVAVFNVAQALPLYAVTFTPVDKDGEQWHPTTALQRPPLVPGVRARLPSSPSHPNVLFRLLGLRPRHSCWT
jgi:hypothetical protein